MQQTLMALITALLLTGWRPSTAPSRLLGGTRRFRGVAMSSAPRLLLTSSGLTTPALEASFRRMLESSSSVEPPRITMLVTAQMAPSGTPSARSPGELRRRRWTSAKKGGREVEAQLGLPVECIDCARDDVSSLTKALTGADCIWVTGGNTFFLWHHMMRSGISELVRERVLERGAVYVGCSAGAIVAGSTIRTAFWKGWDDPAAGGALADVDWSDGDRLQGMGLVADAAFFPHYDAEQWAGLIREREHEVERVVRLSDDGAHAYVEGDPVEAARDDGAA